MFDFNRSDVVAALAITAGCYMHTGNPIVSAGYGFVLAALIRAVWR